MNPSTDSAAKAIVREGEGDGHQQPPASSIFEVATQSLNDAAAAISEAGAFVADKAVELSAAGVEMTSDAAEHVAKAGSRLLSGNGLASAIEYLDDAIDEKAIKDAIVGAAEAVGDKLDQVPVSSLSKCWKPSCVARTNTTTFWQPVLPKRFSGLQHSKRECRNDDPRVLSPAFGQRERYRNGPEGLARRRE